MTKVTLELEDRAVQLAAEKARLADLTISEWISQRIVGRRRGRVSREERDVLGYPVGWFDRTTESLGDVADFREPSDPPPAFVAPLEC